MKAGIGSQLGKYTLVSLIGRGGMGVVYLAEDTTLGRQIALKILERGFTDDGHFERRFQQEARVVAALQHPNIVTIHSLEHIDDILAIDMPYLEGGSMAAFVNGGRDARRRMVASMNDALLALACCHDEGIVHRDVKPSNILIRRDGVAMLSDFGLAKILAEQQAVSLAESYSSGFFLGTPRYAPPESWDGQEATPCWDVYSAGMVLYEAFAPRVPYDAPTPLGLVKQIIELPVPPLVEVAPETSPEFSAAVAAMMERDPTRRPQDAIEALEILKKSPEWREAAPEDRATIVTRRVAVPRRKDGRSTRRAFLQIAARRIAPAVGVLGLGAIAGGLIHQRRQINSVAVPTGAEPAAPGTAYAADCGVFDMVDLSDTVVLPAALLMVRGQSAQRWSVLGHAGPQVWMFQMLSNRPAELEFTGNWAGFTDKAASAFEHGELTGSGRWIIPDQEAAVTLEFKNLQNGLRSRRVLMLQRTRQAFSDRDYLASFVTADFTMAIVYNELFPRNLAWGADLETTFLTRYAPQVFVPHMAGANPASVVEDVLHEAIWSPLLPNAQDSPGLLKGYPDTANAWLCVRYDGEALYCAVRMDNPPEEPQLRVSLVPRMAEDAASIARWTVVADASGVRAAQYAIGKAPRDWKCAWTAGLNIAADRLDGVMRIPFASLERINAPSPGERWWLVCQIAAGGHGNADPVAWWGTRNLDALEESTTLVFGADSGG